ncbi:MAG: Crp/Fnr family transcriptional regulator, partial [Gillisia sp.]
MNRDEIILNRYKTSLEQCTLLKGMKNEVLDEFLSKFHEEKWPKKTCILNNERFCNNFYIILEGRLKMYLINVVSGKEITLFIFTKNDVFDLLCFVDGSRHDVFYECLDEVTVLGIPMKELREWLDKHPECYKEFLPYAGKHLRNMENFVSDIVFKNVSTRLVKLFLRNVNQGTKALEFINDLSNTEIANLVGSSGAVVNRNLQKLK